MEQIRVGHIPSLTWNHLGVNDAAVDSSLELNTSVETKFDSLPKGIKRKEFTYAEAQGWLRDHAPEEAPENVIAGKVPIYHPQSFATGLGAEFDAFMQKAREKTEFLEVEDNTSVEHPIRWDIVFRNKNRAATAQLIHIGKNSSLTLITSFRSGTEDEGIAAISTRIVMEEGASLTLVRAQLLGSGFVHLDDVGAALKDNAALTIIQSELGSLQTYVGMQAELVGNGSKLEAKNAYLGRESRKIDINYNVVQRGKKTQCQMTFDGVLDGKAEKRLSDTIDFRRGSKGSVGHEKENVLLLSDDVLNKSLPVILCEEEDMEGGHGATIGQLDDEVLFYLASRGIDRKAAERLMVRARLGAVTREIPDEELRKEMNQYVEEAFAE